MQEAANPCIAALWGLLGLETLRCPMSDSQLSTGAATATATATGGLQFEFKRGPLDRARPMALVLSWYYVAYNSFPLLGFELAPCGSLLLLRNTSY
jgi:hypothetical protein